MRRTHRKTVGVAHINQARTKMDPLDNFAIRGNKTGQPFTDGVRSFIAAEGNDKAVLSPGCRQAAQFR